MQSRLGDVREGGGKGQDWLEEGGLGNPGNLGCQGLEEGRQGRPRQFEEAMGKERRDQ